MFPNHSPYFALIASPRNRTERHRGQVIVIIEINGCVCVPYGLTWANIARQNRTLLSLIKFMMGLATQNVIPEWASGFIVVNKKERLKCPNPFKE